VAFFITQVALKLGLPEDSKCLASTQFKLDRIDNAIVNGNKPRRTMNFFAFVRETTMLDSNSGHKEASPCHFSMN